MIGKAQRKDGYINIYYSVVEPGKEWTNIARNHELYCAGHLLEAAVAHYRWSGKTHFLDIMCRYIDYIITVFGPEENKKHGYPGHQEIEIALLKLHEVRPEQRYFKLAQYFIEERGHNQGEFFDNEARERGTDPTTYLPYNPPSARNRTGLRHNRIGTCKLTNTFVT